MTNNDTVLLPHNIEAEESIISIFIHNPDAYILHEPRLAPVDFYLGKTRIVFEACENLIKRNVVPELTLLISEIERMNKLDVIGGPGYVNELASEWHMAINVNNYARLIKDCSISRQMIEVGRGLVAKSFEPDSNPVELAGSVLESISTIQRGTYGGNDGPVHASVSVGAYLDKIERIQRGFKGLQTGHVDLDRLIVGLDKGQVAVLAARPGMGKSAFAQGVALNAARQNKRVLIFSLEMPEEDVIGRLGAMESGVSYLDVLKNKPDLDWNAVIMGADNIAQMPLFIDDKAALSPTDMLSRARLIQAQHGLDLVIVDHFGQSKPNDASGKQYQDQSDVADGALLMAKELGVPVIGLVQLSRAVENRANKRPVMSDLRDTGKWEENAHFIWLLYRDGYYDPDTEFPNIAEFIVAKNRNGPTGAFNLYWKAALTKFIDLQINTRDVSDTDVYLDGGR